MNRGEDAKLNGLKRVAEVKFPTIWATFRLLGFERPKDADAGRVETALALILGEISAVPTLVRIHSQCATGDVFHSLRCDCHDQLQSTLATIAREGAGVLIYEHQEGRGIGLMEKLRAYELQDEGFDTIEANLRLGHPVDLRDYQLPVAILQYLGISSVRLMTNNPLKLEALQMAGIHVEARVPLHVPTTPESRRYVATKRERLGHFAVGQTSPACNVRDDAYA